MNKILYTSGEFYLLQDWPEEPKLNMIDAFGENRDKKWANPLQSFSQAIEQSKSNKIKISNPELLPVHWVTTDTTSYFLKHQQLKDGDTFDFPDGLRVEIQTELFKTRPFVNDDGDIIGYDAAEVKIAILSKQDNSAHSHTEVGLTAKIADLVHKCMQWQDFEIEGFQMDKFERELKKLLKVEPKEEESQEEWISVKDRLPENTNDVLCFEPLNHQFVGKYTKGHELDYWDDDHDGEYDPIEDQNGTLYLKPGWYENEETPGGEYDTTWVKREVTHWRPLPPPPNFKTLEK
jgi:hypothetical protein